MIAPKGLPAHYTLPLTAILMYLIQLLYFKQNSVLINATVISGALTTATPLLILWGAILMFKAMEKCGSTDLIRSWLDALSQNKIAKLMLIGWAFSFFIEGISGFGTPAVLAAPLLVASGLPAFQVVVFCLIMNTVPVAFGAVGTPIWFGLGELALGPEQLKTIGIKTAFIQSFVGLIIPVLALRFIVSWKDILKNIRFIFISIASTVIPYALASYVTYEFPSIIGGCVGLITTAYCAKKQIGLEKNNVNSEVDKEKLSVYGYFKAFFPLGVCVLLLLITRISGFGLKKWLNTGSSWIDYSLGTIGNLKITTSSVLFLENILQTTLTWRHPLLYIPSLIPFAVVALLCFIFFKMPRRDLFLVFTETSKRITSPFFALIGAMIFVKLFMLGGENAPTTLIGNALSNIAGQGWNFVAVYLGALGSFFAGSSTVSNLTFAPIQYAVAERLNMNTTLILSLQTVGGAMGNMACIHNIVAVCAMLSLKNHEGLVLRKTIPFVFLYGILATLIAGIVL